MPLGSQSVSGLGMNAARSPVMRMVLWNIHAPLITCLGTAVTVETVSICPASTLHSAPRQHLPTYLLVSNCMQPRVAQAVSTLKLAPALTLASDARLRPAQATTPPAHAGWNGADAPACKAACTSGCTLHLHAITSTISLHTACTLAYSSCLSTRVPTT